MTDDQERTIREALAEARQAFEDIENLVSSTRDGKTQQQRLQGILNLCADARERMDKAHNEGANDD